MKKKKTEAQERPKKSAVKKKKTTVKESAKKNGDDEKDARRAEEETLEQKERFIAALAETLGVVAYACKKTGVSRALYEEWRANDPEFARRTSEVDELALDFVEGKAFEEIKNGNARLIQFFLETKGSKRGFGKEEDSEKKQVVVFLTKDETEY